MADETNVILERHDQNIKSLQYQINDLKALQNEIRTMSQTLITLTLEIRRTNEHLDSHENRIIELEGEPKRKLNQIAVAISTSVISCIIGFLFASLLNK